jgi:hypothetical protein
VSTLSKTNNKTKSHFVLLNKKTGKVASTNKWLLVLAARAHTSGDTSGIAGLLPQEQAKKLLVSNELSTKVARRAKDGRLTDKISDQAVTLLPKLAVLFGEQHPIHKTITRENFCVWVTKQLADETSFAYRNALHSGCENLIYNTTGDKPRSKRWWLDQIKKMQS